MPGFAMALVTVTVCPSWINTTSSHPGTTFPSQVAGLFQSPDCAEKMCDGTQSSTRTASMKMLLLVVTGWRSMVAEEIRKRNWDV